MIRDHATPRRTGTRTGVMIAVLLTVGGSLLATGCGSDGAAVPQREYTLRLRAEDQGDRYTYVAEDPLDLRAGDRVTFEMRNAGRLIHDLVVVDEDGSAIATGPAVVGGDSLTLTVDFDEPGFYRLRCNVDDHLTRYDMQVVVEVAAAG